MPKNDLQTVVLATLNEGKVKELSSLLADSGWQVTGMDTYGLEAPEENGGSFNSNALIKARATAQATKLWALADDSGLEVDALGGLPGVDTSSFGGWEKLLSVLQETPENARSARFRCVLALVRPGLPEVLFEGVCEGHISLAPKGSQGFGYDPVFIPAGSTRTFAEMNKDEKAKWSHRGKALQALKVWMNSQHD